MPPYLIPTSLPKKHVMHLKTWNSILLTGGGLTYDNELALKYLFWKPYGLYRQITGYIEASSFILDDL